MTTAKDGEAPVGPRSRFKLLCTRTAASCIGPRPGPLLSTCHRLPLASCLPLTSNRPRHRASLRDREPLDLWMGGPKNGRGWKQGGRSCTGRRDMSHARAAKSRRPAEKSTSTRIHLVDGALAYSLPCYQDSPAHSLDITASGAGAAKKTSRPALPLRARRGHLTPLAPSDPAHSG